MFLEGLVQGVFMAVIVVGFAVVVTSVVSLVKRTDVQDDD